MVVTHSDANLRRCAARQAEAGVPSRRRVSGTGRGVVEDDEEDDDDDDVCCSSSSASVSESAAVSLSVGSSGEEEERARGVGK